MHRPQRFSFVVFLVVMQSAAGCSSRPSNPHQPQALEESIEAFSLLNKPLRAPLLGDDVRRRREEQLAAAQFEYDRDPHDEEAIIWLGRRLAYLGRYREAIDVFTNGLAIQPESYKLLRHRGHRYITTRKLDLAIADLQRAAKIIENVPDEVEPDGQPNRLNIPMSTSHTNIFYHLGLAHFLRGEYADAERAYQRCARFVKNDDMQVATKYWLELTLLRLHRTADANALLDTISADMNVIENHSYHRLLLYFAGRIDASAVSSPDAEDVSIDQATVGFGLGMHDLLQGREDQAIARFRDVTENTNWAAFGHIAAEAELAQRDSR